MRVLAALCVALLVAAAAQAGEWVGASAPAVKLPDQNGKVVDLASYRGQWVALYFYPKNNTPGCTEEAKQFRDHHAALKEKGVAVIGVSVDDVESHRDFAKKLQLPFTLLADVDGTVAKAFGVLRGFGPVKFAGRETFLIDPEGTIVYHYPDVNSRTHAEQVLRDVAGVQQAESSAQQR
ncbi:MAG: peroxiredoxin [Gammaproteobacteria bacterium]